MAIITTSWMYDVLIVILLLFSILYEFYRRKFQYWKRKNIAHSQNPAFLFGDLKKTSLAKKQVGEDFQEIYERKKHLPYYGVWMWFRPTLLVMDPAIIKKIVITDFMNFHDHGMYYNENHDPLSGHLFALDGLKWRNLRVKLSPTFTSGKMKMMFPIFEECTNEMMDLLIKQEQTDPLINIKDILARLMTDIISSCAFGIQTNSIKNPDSEFRKMGMKFFTPTFETAVRLQVTQFIPQLAGLMRLNFAPRDVNKFFLARVKETVEFREKNNVQRRDFMNLLLQLKNKGVLEDVDSARSGNTTDEKTTVDSVHRFSLNEVAAQCFIFFIAGFETSSSTAQFACYELARNPDIQKKLQENIDDAVKRHGGHLTYEAIQEMEYLDRVISETLRMYPPVPVLTRNCNKPYTLPGTNTVIDKDVLAIIPVFALHRDKNHYPNPEKFDPDRFTEENKSKRDNYVYMPFGEGPRVCIGSRFGLLQVKIALASVLSKFDLSTCGKTPENLQFDPKVFILTAKQDIYLRISTRVS